MKFAVLLIMLAFASENQTNRVESAKSEEKIKEENAEDLILVKIEEDNYAEPNNKTSQYFGVSYCKSKARWAVSRWSKGENKTVCNGYYKDEETAAHASDTLARKLMENGERNHKLNFPGDHTEVLPDKTKTSKFIGVSCNESKERWRVQRWSTTENQIVYNGSYKDEETAAHASDTLARKLMTNGEQNLKLNFADDHTEVYPQKKKTSKYFGLSYNASRAKWNVQRWNKTENKNVYNGTYKDEETAAHASDTLARKLLANGAQNLKLNFPEDDTEVIPANQNNKRKRSELENMDPQNK